MTDAAYYGTFDPFWARASGFMLGAGLLLGAGAAVVGLVDFLSIQRVRNLAVAWAHMIGNIMVLALSFGNYMLRRNNTTKDGTPGVPGTAGFTLSAMVAATIFVTGWLGGEMTYRHRIGLVNKPHQ